jgi:hypothetical protein
MKIQNKHVDKYSIHYTFKSSPVHYMYIFIYVISLKFVRWPPLIKLFFALLPPT